MAVFRKEKGFGGSALGEPPKTTPSDIMAFFEKLHTGKLAKQENTFRMLEILKRQTLNKKLPKYLPKEVSSAHKTGEIGFFSHDAGIVFREGGDYIIAVLSESDHPSGAEERIAEISRAVFKYFEGSGE